MRVEENINTKLLTSLFYLNCLFVLSSAPTVITDDYQDAKNAYKIKDYKMTYQLWLPLAKKGNAEASCVENSI